MANGLNNSNLKSNNRGLLLQLIATEKHPSRAELARKSNLTKMAVSKIVNGLIEDGLVAETGITEKGTVGRNPIGLGISPSAPKTVGLLIDRKYCIAVLCDLEMNVLMQEQINLDESCDNESLQNIIFILLDRIFENPDAHNILGIGVGTVGPVDIDKGIILSPVNFYGISNFPIAAILQQKYNVPVLVDNQCNSAAIIERYFGIGRLFSDFVYIGITDGIGSGIITNGQIIRNANGLTSEIGHMSIGYNGPLCTCGNHGCLEAYIGTPVISRKVKERTDEKLTFREICERDKIYPYNEVLDDMIEKLGVGLTNYVNLLNPQAIVLGHESYWLPLNRRIELEQIINKHKLSNMHHYVQVVKPFFAEKTIVAACTSPITSLVFSGDL